MRMKHEVISRRRATNVTLPDDLVAEARRLKVNLSKASEAGVNDAVRRASKEAWKAEHADWIQAHRRWSEANPLPLERYRLF